MLFQWEAFLLLAEALRLLGLRGGLAQIGIDLAYKIYEIPEGTSPRFFRANILNLRFLH